MPLWAKPADKDMLELVLPVPPFCEAMLTIICVNLLKALYRGISVNFHGIVDIVNLQVFHCQATTVYLPHLLPAFRDETGL